MKYLVVSDIHGAAESAAAVPEIFAYHKADAILLLGDVLYHKGITGWAIAIRMFLCQHVCHTK